MGADRRLPVGHDEAIIASKVSAPDQRASQSTVEKDKRAVWAVREG